MSKYAFHWSASGVRNNLVDVTVDGIWDNGYYDTAILRNHPYDRLTVRQSWIAFCGHGQQPGVSFSEAKRHGNCGILSDLIARTSRVHEFQSSLTLLTLPNRPPK